MLYEVITTKGQASPTTEPDWDNKLSPGGTGIRSFHPLVIALAAGANFVARAFSGDPNVITSYSIHYTKLYDPDSNCRFRLPGSR